MKTILKNKTNLFMVFFLLILALAINSFAQSGDDYEDTTTLESADETPTGDQDYVDEGEESSDETESSDSSEDF